MRHLFLTASVLLSAACATAPTDIAFGTDAADLDLSEKSAPAGDQAMLLLAIGPVGTAGGYVFQSLNEENSDFGAESINLTFGAWGVGDKMKRPEDEKSSLWILDQKEINFLIKKVDPGLYAATYATWNTYNGVSSGSAWNCLTDGAYVFDIQPGMINIVSSRDAFPPGTVTRLTSQISDQQIVEQFARTRVNYPDLHGDPIVLAPIFEARWQEKKGGLFSAPCEAAEPESFSLSRIQSEAAQSEPDAAEQAAIAAALANLENKTEKTDLKEEED